MQQLSQTIEYGNQKVTVTVRGKSGFDKYVERVLFSRMYEAIVGKPYTSAEWWTPETQAVDQITAVISRTVSVTGLSIPWATAQSDSKELCQSYEYVKQIPAPIWEAWVDLLEKANQPPGDPETQPPNKLSDDKKKTPE